MTTEETTRTPEPDDGDAAEQTPTTETPVQDERNAAQEQEAKVRLEHKIKAEKLNALETKYGPDFETVLDRAVQSPAVRSEAPEEEDEAYWASVKEWSDKGDPVAKATLRSEIQRRRDRKEILDALDLREIGDANERREVLDHYARNRHRLGDVAAARAEIHARKLADENKKLREAVAISSKRRDPEVVSTVEREHSAKETKVRQMSSAEYDRQIAELDRQGLHRKKMDLQNQYARGDIDVID